MRTLVTQLGRFGLIGAVGFGVDFVLFNVLRATVLDPHHVQHGSLWANVISTSAAIIINWAGNRYWTFRHVRRPHLLREGIEFAVVSLGGLLISLACLWISQNAFGFTGVVADNIAKNVVGLGLGTIFRFTFYRLWVFRGEKEEMETGDILEPVESSPTTLPTSTSSTQTGTAASEPLT